MKCEGVKSEEIAYCLKRSNRYKIWVYEDKVYAICKVKSLLTLQSFMNKMKTRKIRFKFLKIEKFPWWKAIW